MSAALTTDVDKRLLRTTKFPPEFNIKVDMTKVNIPVIKKWVSDEILRILENEDDVVTEIVFNLIEGPRYPNIKELQITMNGFLDKDAAKFSHNLWKLCLSAQENPQGIPKELLEAKKTELANVKLEEDRKREEARKRQEAERERDQDLARMRGRERDDRRGGKGRYGDRDPLPRRDSRSPPPRKRREDDDFYSRRGTDSYMPSSGRQGNRRRRTSPSRSRSPPPKRRRRSTPEVSRSPPPRRRRLSSSSASSVSRERGKHRRENRHGERRRDRSPSNDRRRSRSPRRHRDHRRRSPSSDSDRYPLPKRSRRGSPSPPRGTRNRYRPEPRSRSPVSRGHTKRKSDEKDLIPRVRRDEPRLSRESSEPSATSSLGDTQERNGSSPGLQQASKSSAEKKEDGESTNGGAETVNNQEVGDDS